MQEVDKQTRQVVAKEIVEVLLFVKKMMDGFYEVQSAGEMECAGLNSTLCLPVSAVSLTGSIRKCLVVGAVGAVVAAEVVSMSPSYIYDTEINCDGCSGLPVFLPLWASY